MTLCMKKTQNLASGVVLRSLILRCLAVAILLRNPKTLPPQTLYRPPTRNQLLDDEKLMSTPPRLDRQRKKLGRTCLKTHFKFRKADVLWRRRPGKTHFNAHSNRDIYLRLRQRRPNENTSRICSNEVTIRCLGLRSGQGDYVLCVVYSSRIAV